jgi:hypothetical protein
MNLLDMSERSSKDQVPEIFEQQRRRQSDQGTPDGGMSSVSKTAISEDEQHQAVRSNMIHQFEREVSACMHEVYSGWRTTNECMLGGLSGSNISQIACLECQPTTVKPLDS